MRRAWLRGGTALLAMLIISLVAATGAAAAVPPVVAGLTLTPTSAPIGTSVQVTATATNTTPSAVAASMGIDIPATLRVSNVSGSGGCHPRNLTHLVYCGVQSLAPNATATITLTVTPTASGAFDLRSYARVTYSSDNSFAYVTLTVS